MVNGKPYHSYKYEQILKEQLLIAYLSKGAITITETDDMPINDRKILLTTICLFLIFWPHHAECGI